MVFPELRSWFRKHWPGDSGEPIRLNLKAATSRILIDGIDAEWYLHNGFPQIYSMLAGRPTWSGESVTRETALNHSVVWACYRLITETMGVLPASVMIKNNSGKVEVPEHPMYSAMHNAPNDDVSAQTFKEMLTGHCMLDGDGFAKINRRSGTGTALSLEPLLPERVIVDREKQGQKRLVYEILNARGQTEKTYTVQAGKPHDILHLRGLSRDGLRGHNVIEIARQSLGTAISGERNVAGFWAHGGREPYMIQGTKFKTEQDGDNYAKKWRQDSADPHRVMFLGGEGEYVKTGSSMVDAQALESRQFTVSEITRWWGVSPHLAGDLSHGTFSNIEHLFLEFKTLTASRWAKRWEQDFWRCVLTPEEKSAGYFLRVNVNALLRGDFTTRMQGYSQALQNGHMNIDEVRDLEDRNPLPEGAGSHYHIQVNMGTLSPAGQLQDNPKVNPGLVRLDQSKN